MNRYGFTLLEVIISIALMTFLTIFTAQSIQKAVQSRQKIQGQIDRDMELREAVNLVTRDIQLAFNYRDINIELYNKAIDAKNRKPTTTPSSPSPGTTPTPTPSPTPDPGGNGSGNGLQKKKEVIVTQFMGEEDNLNFSSLSRIRTQKDEALSDQAEIGYYIDSCKSRKNRGESSKCLWRRVSPYIDDDIKEGGKNSVVIEGVQSIQFRYIGPGAEEEWIRNWSSDGSGQEFMKGNFPYAVEVTLEVLDTRFDPPKTMGLTAVAQLRFPNNPVEKEEENPNAANPQ